MMGKYEPYAGLIDSLDGGQPVPSKETRRTVSDDEVSALAKRWLQTGYRNEQDAAKKYDHKELVPQDELLRLVMKFNDLLKDLKSSISGDVFDAISREEAGDLRSGEWIDNPVAGVNPNDGHAFGSDTSKRRGTRLQVNLGLDLSASMTSAVGWSTPAAQMKTDTAKLGYFPRIFLASMVARHIRSALTETAKETNLSMMVGAWGFGVQPHDVIPYEGQVWLKFPNSGGTPLYPLMKAISKYEAESGYPGASRLDLIVTDGAFDETYGWNAEPSRFGEGGVKGLQNIQYQRTAGGGSLVTVVLDIANDSTDKNNRYAGEQKKRIDAMKVPFMVTYEMRDVVTLARVMSESISSLLHSV